MKIALFNNLEKGGALNSIIYILKYLSQNNKVDIYGFQNNIPKNLINHTYIYKNTKTKNIFQNIIYIIFRLKKIHYQIACDINQKKYDLILVFPCILTQSPYILRFLNQKEKVIYFFTEPKREFYEKTSFKYWSLKNILIRIIRLPIKYIDKKNCKFAKKIISNSIFTANNLKNKYHKNSTIIYPGLKPIMPKKIIIKNNKKILSVGQISKIKGHDFSIKQLSNTDNITILGRETTESEYIYKLAKKKNLYLNIITSENDKLKDNLYQYYSIYLANNNNEPFGIATLEASSKKCFILGKNEGGTSEIVQNGINGLLYSNLYEAKKILNKIIQNDKLIFYQTNTIDWRYTSNRILEFYNRSIRHESTE